MWALFSEAKPYLLQPFLRQSNLQWLPKYFCLEILKGAKCQFQLLWVSTNMR